MLSTCWASCGRGSRSPRQTCPLGEEVSSHISDTIALPDTMNRSLQQVHLQARPPQATPKAWSLRVFASAARKDAPASQEGTAFNRRHLLATTLMGPAAANLLLQASAPLPARAEGVETFTDPIDKFTISYPSGWATGEGDMMPNANRFQNSAGQYRVWGAKPTTPSNVSVSITVAPVNAQYTGLGSFGNAQTFADNLVGSMDRSYLLRGSAFGRPDGPVQTAKLLNAREGNGMYYVTYQVAKVNEPVRVVNTVVAMGNNGRLVRFYTVNASCAEDEVELYGALLKQVVDSFRVPPL